MRHLLLVLSIVVLSFAPFAWTSPARADDKDIARETQAAEAFGKGVELVKAQEWGNALASFEKAQSLKPHALTLYNMGIAEMRLGRLTRARWDFLQALDLDTKTGHTQLAPSFADETAGLVRDLDARLVYVEIAIDPLGSVVTIDGRPLILDPSERTKLYVAGIAAATDASPALPQKIGVAVDPGDHDILLQKEGFTPVATKATHAAGERAELPLSLTAMEATIHVSADRPGAVVRLQDLDIGVAPVTVKRPPGTYMLDVRSPGAVTYRTTVNVGPGGRADLNARLPNEPFAISKQWWFWTGLAVLLVGAGVTVYAVTRPTPPFDGGTTGWVAQPR